MAQTEMANGDKPINVYHPVHPWNNESANGFFGLTKREYFAAMAMQGLINEGRYSGRSYLIAITAVEIADQLLKVLDIPKFKALDNPK